MIWVDREAKRLKKRHLPLEWVDDMKTPSGRIHVGSLRGVIIHDLIYKALKETGVNTKFSYVFNDMDPMDGLPIYLNKDKWEKYLGFPLYKIPSLEKGFQSYAHYFAQEFIDVFNSLNCYPQIIWSSDLYRSGKMNKIIKNFLDNASKVREIYKKVAKAEKPNNWFPYNPICQKCGKVGTTNVYKWDGKYVHYRCEVNMVQWTKGCGYQGKIEPINENGKLPWKLDWAAHWKVIGVTIESSGKDHMSSGGAYDIACHLAKEILKINPPDALGGYEWFTVGGRKMSSSKGIGSSAKEVAQILPPEILRFLLVRTPIKTHLDFNPYGETIPRLFDEYDRCLNAYFNKLENRIPQGKPGEVMEDFARIITLSQVNPLPKKRIYLPRFRTIVNLLKLKNNNPTGFFKKQKGKSLNKEEEKLLKERLKYAKIYLTKYSQDESIIMPKAKYILNENQKRFLKILAKKLEEIKKEDKEKIKDIIFQSIKEAGINSKEGFSAFYQTLINQNYGPKAINLILQLGLKKTIEKLKRNLN